MARKLGRLSALDVRRAKMRGLYNDGGGLYLSIDRAGNQSWIFRYGAQGARHKGLGPLHTIGLAEARDRARACRKLLLDGIDPIADGRARKAAARLEQARAITFAEAAETYICAVMHAFDCLPRQQQYDDFRSIAFGPPNERDRQGRMGRVLKRYQFRTKLI